MDNFLDAVYPYVEAIYSAIGKDIYIILTIMLIITGGLFLISGVARGKLLKQRKAIPVAIKKVFAQIENGGKDRVRGYLKIMLLIFAILSIIKALTDLKAGCIMMLIGLLLYEALQPNDKLFGIKSPYLMIVGLIDKANQDTYRQELYEASIQLKNLVISNKAKGTTSHYMLSQLLPYTNLTKPFFAQLMSMNMKDESEKAAELFREKFGIKLAADFVYIVQRLDIMDPDEFTPLIDTLLLNFREENKTKQVEAQTKKSNFLFLLSSAEILALIADFVIIIFVEMIEQMTLL